MAPREGFTDAVVTFALMDGDNVNTKWFRNISFPLFIFNSIQVLGNAREAVRRRGAPARPAGRPARRDDQQGDRGRLGRPARREGAALAPGDVHLPRRRQDGRLPRPMGARRPAAVRGQPVRRPRERPRPPRPGPRGRPRRPRPRRTRSRSATTPSPAPAKPSRSARNAGGPSPCWSLGVLLVEWYIYNRRVYI